MRRLTKKQLAHISKVTFHKCRNIGLRHAQENRPYIKNTVVDLKGKIGKIETAVVFSAGPSLHIKDPARLILNTKYKGAIICADGALYYCLRKGIVPDYVVSVDPHSTRIVRLFGDPYLKQAPADDYFRRQDLEPALNKDEIKRNQEIIKLLNRYGKRIKMIISTSVTPKITRRCLQAGMKLYWWNPIYDDYDKAHSLTREIFKITGAPCMSTGGNVGTSSWVFASVILEAKNIALVGMDLGYPPDTPFYKTQYYYELKQTFGERFKDGFIKLYNPYLKQTWYTDPAYFWYRENFLKLLSQVDSVTYNCTEGGILFGRQIKFVRLKDFLTRFNPLAETPRFKPGNEWRLARGGSFAEKRNTRSRDCKFKKGAPDFIPGSSTKRKLKWEKR